MARAAVKTRKPDIRPPPLPGFEPPRPDAIPFRMLLQRLGPATIKRHVKSAITRVFVLFVADLLTYAALHVTLVGMRTTPVGGQLSSPLWTSLPHNYPGSWHFAVALLIGLVLAGTYGRGDQRKDGGRIMAGVFFATGLTFWSSFWLAPFVPVAISFVLTFVIVSAVFIVQRRVLDMALSRFLLSVGSWERVVFVGDPESPTGKEMQEHFLDGTRMNSLGWITPTGQPDMAYGGEVRDIWDILHEINADTVIMCGEFPASQFSEVVEAAATSGCRVLSSSRYSYPLGSRISWYRGTPVMELSLPALKGQQLAVKRAIDLAAASIGLVLLAPVFLLIALRIKLDSPGPVFFSQERVGFGGHVFKMIKFRTMRATADDEKELVAHLNQTGDPRLFKIANDPRVTKFGAFLRSWSLDELPQLWNVLKGDMSLVGPRPFFENDLLDYRDYHFDRLAAKPGITGLWQVMGRSSVVDFEEVVRLDREYVSRWSLRLDLFILMRTLPAVLTRKGAY
jgi:exopolysaccharide biosynthesis polyprenyl glycosylphosphotransferase